LVAIAEAFQREREAAGQRPLLLLLPERRDLRHFRRTGRWATEPLRAALERRGVPYLHFGPVLADEGLQDLDALFVQDHYSPPVHALLARRVEAELRARGWLD
jgi:hypothetical protein